MLCKAKSASTLKLARLSTSDALLSLVDWQPIMRTRLWIMPVQYVDGRVHTNGLENFWSLLKRGISGTYVSVEPFHLFRYLDEQTFRYNNRKDLNDGQRFAMAMTQVAGKRPDLRGTHRQERIAAPRNDRDAGSGNPF